METEFQENRNNLPINPPSGQQSDFSSPPQPLRRKKKGLFWFLIILAIALAAIFLYVFKPKNNLPVKPAPEPEYIITPENTKTMLKGQSKIIFPEITGREVGNAADLGKDLEFLNYQGAGDFKINKVAYADGSSGLEVSFVASNPLQEFYFDMLGKLKVAKWENLFSSRALLAVIVDAGKTNQKLKIIATKNNDGITEVYAQSIFVKQ